jgi:peptidoglycan/LPS O-acetylase OafA/YrhL
MAQCMGTGQKYPGLEAIRALAALVVVYNHVSDLLVLPTLYAAEAVMIFFVLSGVVITLSVERKRRHSVPGAKLALEYLGARLLRIYPIFIVGLLLAVIAERLINGTWPDSSQIAGNALFMQSLRGYIVFAPPYNTPLWSLSNEMFYYFLFALCSIWRRLLAVWLLVALITASLLYPPRRRDGFLT